MGDTVKTTRDKVEWENTVSGNILDKQCQGHCMQKMGQHMRFHSRKSVVPCYLIFCLEENWLFGLIKLANFSLNDSVAWLKKIDCLAFFANLA